MKRIKELNRYEEHTRKKAKKETCEVTKLTTKKTQGKKQINNIYKIKHKKEDSKALRCEEHTIYYTNIYKKKNHMCCEFLSFRSGVPEDSLGYNAALCGI
jgi:hypothetical protein